MKTNSVQSGQPCCALTSRPAIAAAEIRVTGRSTRRWPCRSTSRDTCGLSTAEASATVAARAPARPYLPVSRETMVTMPMLVIDSVIRPRKPAAVNDLVPGVSKSARYGLGMGELRR